jgi:hypothetical protein
MKQYIINEDQIGRWCGCISVDEAGKILDEVLSNPYNPQQEREKVLEDVRKIASRLLPLSYYYVLRDKIEELRKGGEQV